MSSKHPQAEVRAQFLEFFARHGHRKVPSSPVFPQDDPTLLFTNAGMNQFKDVFLGTGTRDYTRAVDTQKCIRVSGKHNDLEEVGHDTYHHTFFEMLGNWSFGDYFKAEAIPWAWELLTGVWKMPKERLWVTVFGGDEADGLPADEDAERIWREKTDIRPDHVLRFGRKDNFWEMGDTGPCGPCSEIHIDRGGPGVDPEDGRDRKKGVNAGNERFIELWNLVFMEFNRLDDGSLKQLPAQNVDTGMGFERLLAVLQGKSSNYDTDLFSPLFARLRELTKHAYSGSMMDRKDIAFRVIADHVRAVTSAFADGALPSNTGRGYVLRRLIRRASRYGRQELGMEQPFLFEVVPAVAQVLGPVFPEIAQRVEHVRLLVREEEESFGRTLGRGLVRFEELVRKVEASPERVLPGEETYELYATYGFPQDLVALMARERDIALDDEGWARAQKAHQEASKSEGKFKQLLSTDELDGLPATVSAYHEIGHAGLACETDLLLCASRGEGSGEVTVVLAQSPFYPEAGGQIGDSGKIEAIDGSFAIEIEDAKKLGAVVVHIGRVIGGSPVGKRGVRVRAEVDADRRARTRKNHTATHLLHKALKQVLGEHVVQQGSYVGPDRLRFDFAHPKGLTPEEIERVEEIVNAQVFANARVGTTVEELEEAKARGVVALFGEKYDQRVRVVDVGGWSTELCGGTHVSAAGDIGPFLILSERAIQAGVRRIEALTGPGAVEEMQKQRRLLQEASRALKAAPEEIGERIQALQTQLKESKKQKARGAAADVAQAVDAVRDGLADHGGVRAGVVALDLDQGALRELAGRAKGLFPDMAAVLLGRDGDKVPFIVVCQGAALERGLRADTLARELAGVLGGGGGGKADTAQGQGQRADRLEEAKQAVERLMAAAAGAR